MKVLILGNGVHTNKRILPALEKIKEIDEVTVGDRNIIEDISASKKTRISNYDKVTSPEGEYDIGIIATPPYNHIESFEKINEKCNKILIEKPITNDVNWIFGSEFKKYFKNKNIFESLMYFHHPLWKEVKNIVQSGNIKKIITEFSVPHLPKGSHRYSKKYGGGSLNDQGMYPISLVSELMMKTYEIKDIKIFSENNYEVDLSGEFEIILDSNIEVKGIWGLGKEYKNFVNLIDKEGKTYEIKFIFSKPDGTDTKIIIKNDELTEEINVGVHDQFEIMYMDAINSNNSNFNYSNYKNLIKRYDIYKKISDEINF